MLPSIRLPDVAIEICKVMNFTLCQSVGKGGFKHTFKIKDKHGSFWALKIYQSTAKSERTEREISAMTRCSNCGIATIHYIDRINYGGSDYLFLVEEYIGGGTLSERLTKGLFNHVELINFGNQLINIVEYISSLELIHRDIKPDNILYRDNERDIVLTDFGIVRDLGADSLTPTFLTRAPGTHGFAAPEQETNQKILEDWRTDQFSCGIVFSFCAFGINPFGNNLADAYNAISSFGDTTQDFKAAVINSGYTTIQKMVEVWPINRFHRIQDLRDAWNN